MLVVANGGHGAFMDTEAQCPIMIQFQAYLGVVVLYAGLGSTARRGVARRGVAWRGADLPRASPGPAGPARPDTTGYWVWVWAGSTLGLGHDKSSLYMEHGATAMGAGQGAPLGAVP